MYPTIVHYHILSLQVRLLFFSLSLPSHSKAGYVSAKRGGGSYEFTINPKPNTNLDKENIVFGKVLEGMDVIEKINGVPTSKEDPIGSKEKFAAAGKKFDPRAKIIYLYKPLVKIVVKKAGRLTASP